MTSYRRRPTEVEIVRENGDGTVAIRDLVTGETSNVKKAIFDALYEPVLLPPLEAPGFLGEIEDEASSTQST